MTEVKRNVQKGILYKMKFLVIVSKFTMILYTDVNGIYNTLANTDKESQY